MPIDLVTKKWVFVLSCGIFFAVVLHTSTAFSSNEHLKEVPSSGEFVKVQNALRQWDPYSELLADQSFEDHSEEKRGSKFYPLRGKKDELDSTVKENLPDLSSLYMKEGEQKKAMAFVPVRGRKASYFIPTRGRKASAFTAMRGKKDEEPTDVEDTSYWKNTVSGERSATSSPRQDDQSRALRGMEVTLAEEYDKDDDHSILEDMDKRAGKGFFGSRGKRRVFPFVTTWKVFQRLRAPVESQGAKREALFFASRGKRSSDVVLP